MRVFSLMNVARKTVQTIRLRFFAIALYSTIAVVSGAILTPAMAQTFNFSTIRVDGNNRVDDATITGFARIARGTSVSAAELNAAYQRITNSGLFETVEMTPSGRTLIIEVLEFPVIGLVNFEGNRRIEDDEIAAYVQTQAGRILSPTQVEADVVEIGNLYRARGRIAADITPRIIPRGNGRVDLAFEINEGDVVEIERLSFVGNTVFSDRRLQRVLETKEAGLFRRLVQRDTFVPERIALDRELLRDFYLSRGYIDFEVLSATPEISRQRDAYFVTFTVREGQQFTFGQITTVSEIEGLDAAPFEAEVRVRSGVIFSPTVLEANIQRMERVATERGMRFVRVEPRITRNDRDGTLEIEFAVVNGDRVFIERIDIQGNNTTLDRVVRRQFHAAEGDPLNPREIREAAERIRALGFFSDVQVDQRRGGADDQVIVDVGVEEQPTGSLGFGVSYGVNIGIGLSATFAETNFLGRGQAFNFSLGTIPGSRELSMSFSEPALLGRDLRLNFSLGYAETTQQNAAYDTTTGNFSIGLQFPVSEFGRFETRVGASIDQVFNVSTDSSTRLQSDEAQGTVSVATIGYTYTLDTRRNGLDPTRGYVFEFGQDFGFGASSRSYVNSNFRAGYEQRFLNDELTLRVDVTGGLLSMISGESRINDRFSMNGRMRGFAPNGAGPRDLVAVNQDAMGGNAFAVAKFEADFSLGLPDEYGISGGVFMDVGSVWNIDNPGTVDDSMNLRAAAGVSLFWDTPIGPLRFNFSRPLRRETYDQQQNFDLTIVSRF
jgi:outer membrane protein insertion porin family